MTTQGAFASPSMEGLAGIRDALAERIRSGLRAAPIEGPGAVRCLPSHVLLPERRPTSGEAIVLDTGGTWVRAYRVDLATDEVVATAPALRLERGRMWSVEALLDAHVDRIVELSDGRPHPIGWVWSFPAEALPDGDARHLRWTKDVPIAGTLDRVGAGLRSRLDRRGQRTGPIRVLNDTVAALVAGWACRDGGYDDATSHLGLIVGTGHNVAIEVDEAWLTRLDAPRAGRRHVVNLESGNFDPGPLDPLDEALDAAGPQPGWQRIEKAVSGYTLGALLAAARGEPPTGDAGDVVAAALHGDPVATALLDRSADLVAAAVAGAARVVGLPVAVCAEGSVFWSPGYPDRFLATCARLGAPVQLLPKRAGTNALGAAIVAAASVA